MRNPAATSSRAFTNKPDSGGLQLKRSLTEFKHQPQGELNNEAAHHNRRRNPRDRNVGRSRCRRILRGSLQQSPYAIGQTHPISGSRAAAGELVHWVDVEGDMMIRDQCISRCAASVKDKLQAPTRIATRNPDASGRQPMRHICVKETLRPTAVMPQIRKSSEAL